MNGVLAGISRNVDAKNEEAEGEGEMAMEDVERLVGLLIESGRKYVPPHDPELTERVWRRLLAELGVSRPPRRQARMT